MTKDPYEVLGISRGASNEEVKRAWRQAAIKHHPDRNPDDPDAEKRFKEAQEAYLLLTDPGKRHIFDRTNAIHESRKFWGLQDDLFDTVFRHRDPIADMFRRRNNYSARPVTQTDDDIEAQLNITVEESVTGCKKQMQVQSNKKIRCLQCAGTGRMFGGQATTCNTCGGYGHNAKICALCDSFKQRTKSCQSCNGTGMCKFEREVIVTVPVGIVDGTRLRLAGMGVPGQPPGNLYITVKIREASNHSAWSRLGQDLITTRCVSLQHAIIGGPLEVSLPNGRGLTIEIPPGTQPGDEMCISGQGVRPTTGGQCGDVRIVITVALPKTMTSRAKKLLDELVEELETRTQ
jgi:molecular chaperone DnaJ